VGINEDFDAGYRPKGDYLEWLKLDPIRLQREKLGTLGFSDQQILDLEKGVEEQIARSTDFADESAFADASELHKGVFI
jgi:TPP-dependent pyruvate/acetoin dehydrogenase alpha subunit